jgi:hypothetical protein
VARARGAPAAHRPSAARAARSYSHGAPLLLAALGLLTPRRPLLIRPKQVIKYFYYKLRYANEPMPPEFPIEPSMALELLMAANYLDA